MSVSIKRKKKLPSGIQLLRLIQETKKKKIATLNCKQIFSILPVFITNIFKNLRAVTVSQNLDYFQLISIVQ